MVRRIDGRERDDLSCFAPHELVTRVIVFDVRPPRDAARRKMPADATAAVEPGNTCAAPHATSEQDSRKELVEHVSDTIHVPCSRVKATTLQQLVHYTPCRRNISQGKAQLCRSGSPITVSAHSPATSRKSLQRRAD